MSNQFKGSGRGKETFLAGCCSGLAVGSGVTRCCHDLMESARVCARAAGFAGSFLREG